MALNIMNWPMKQSWIMEMKQYLRQYKDITMCYTDVIVRVSVDVLGPLYVVPGPLVL